MEEVIKEPWSYVLYQEGENHILSVLCGSVATYDLTVRLTTQEEESYQREGKAYIDELAAKIQYSPSSYQSRRIVVDD